MKIQITKIKLKLDKREIELTAEEARAMYDELGKLFAIEKTTFVPVPYPIYPAPIIQPIVIERDRIPWQPYRWKITCGSGSTTGVTENGSTLLVTCNA